MGKSALSRVAAVGWLGGVIAAGVIASLVSHAAESSSSVDAGKGTIVAAKDGRLVFDNTRIGDAVEVFNRYNVAKLHVADARLAQKRISGVFEATRPESFVAFLESVVKVRVSHDGLVTTLTSL